MRRRRLLALAGTTLPAALTGCLGDEGNEDSDSTDEEPAAATESDSAGDEGGETDETSSEDSGADEGGESDGEGGDSNSDSSDDSDDSDESWTEPDWPAGPYADYDSTLVQVNDESGQRRGQVRAAIANPGDQWTLGLSDAESMPENGGMLFISESGSDLTFWMRRMSFGLDIVYVDENREITSIHHAPEPGPDEDGTEEKYQYSGYGQYVLEVNHQWTTERGITAGDVLAFEL